MSFDKNALKSYISKIFSENGLSSLMSKETLDKFILLTELMLTENEKYNLTAIKEPEKIAVMHYLDCAMLTRHLAQGASVIDIGCGGGFPSLPVAILRPDLKITSIDSTAKKINYIKYAATELGITGINAHAARAEELAVRPEWRESFDIATARAVAALPILAELCIPFVKPGGKFLAMKGKNAKYELAEAKRAIATLGGRLEAVDEVRLSYKDEVLEHPIILVAKERRSPAAYPRAYAQISKKPL